MLKPQPLSKPSIELLAQAPTMDNNKLQKLVKNFVVEDKARLAARNKNMASSIQYALQKFEKNAQPEEELVKNVPVRTNNYNNSVEIPSAPSPSVQVRVFLGKTHTLNRFSLIVANEPRRLWVAIDFINLHENCF